MRLFIGTINVLSNKLINQVDACTSDNELTQERTYPISETSIPLETDRMLKTQIINLGITKCLTSKKQARVLIINWPLDLPSTTNHIIEPKLM